MNPTRDEILRLLMLMGLKSIDGITDIDVRNILKYSEPFEILEDLQIPYVGYVKSLIADTGGGVQTLTYTEADLVDDGGGGWYLPLNLTGTQITTAVKSTSGFAKAGGDIQSVNGFTDNSSQTITVFVLGIEGDFVATVLIDNNSSAAIDYTVGSGSGTILTENDITGPTPTGTEISVTIILGQTCVYTIYNQDGSVYFTNTQVGPGTINGIPTTDDTRQEFIISNT